MRWNIVKSLINIGMQKDKYYNLQPILDIDAHYRMIIGKRSNGKTYVVQKFCLQKYHETGRAVAIVRRLAVDFTSKTGQNYWEGVVNDGLIEEYTDGKYDSVFYQSMRWWFCKRDPETGKKMLSPKPFAYFFPLNTWEHDKGPSYPDINTIVFDEFISTVGMGYLRDEFVIFMNVISTIIRQRDEHFDIFMLGNTINMYGCPYFQEMGIDHIKYMKQGTIEVYKYGDTGNSVAIEYVHDRDDIDSTPTNSYYAFNNPKLDMITHGAWEVDVHPHLTPELYYKYADVKYKYYMIYEGELLQCNIIVKDGYFYTYIHEKTTPIPKNNKSLIYTQEHFADKLHRRSIFKPMTEKEKRIQWFFKHDRVFYQNNMVGEIVANFLRDMD